MHKVVVIKQQIQVLEGLRQHERVHAVLVLRAHSGPCVQQHRYVLHSREPTLREQ